jgi:hypothetical protein
MGMLAEQQVRRILTEVDRTPAARPFGVAFVGRGQCRALRQPSMPAGLGTWVVLQEADDGPSLAPPAQGVSLLDALRGREGAGMWLSCGSAVLAGFAVAGGMTAAPVTAGASTAVTVLSWAALVSSSAQCLNGGWRVFNEMLNPSRNDELDSERWYTVTSDVLDAVSVAGGVAGLGQAAQVAIRLGRTSGRPLLEILRGMNRAERKRLAQDLAKYAGEAATRRQFIRLARAGRVPSVFTRAQVDKAILSEILSSISSGLDLAGSAAFGVVRKVAVRLVEEQ